MSDKECKHWTDEYADENICILCGEKMLLNYMCDEDQFSAYYICEDCPAEDEVES